MRVEVSLERMSICIGRPNTVGLIDTLNHPSLRVNLKVVSKSLEKLENICALTSISHPFAFVLRFSDAAR